MEETAILQPLYVDVNEDEKLHKNNWEKLAKFFTNLQPKHCEVDFDAFLHTLQISLVFTNIASLDALCKGICSNVKTASCAETSTLLRNLFPINFT
jgi:hypothetical protein